MDIRTSSNFFQSLFLAIERQGQSGLAPTARGALTFEAEGSAVRGPLFSRHLHFPGGKSGVTIGRGYDMKNLSPHQAMADLISAGVPSLTARTMALGSGLKGEAARKFTEETRDRAGEISKESEKRLFFSVTYPRAEADVKRIMASKDVTGRYGAKAWEDTPPRVRELLTDLRYRGDYTAATRKKLQPLVAANNLAGLRVLMNDRAYWSALGVPRDRIERRASFVNTYF